MSLQDNTSGLLLDKSKVRTVTIELPQIKRTRRYEVETDILHEAYDEYGEVIFFGDWHLGHEEHAHNPFKAYLQLIIDNPHIRVVMMGDYFEYSKQSGHIADEIMDIDDQIELFVKTLRKIRDQVDVILPGNHDHRLTKYTGRRRYLQGFAREAGVDLDETYVALPQRGANIFVNSGDMKYSIYALHGSTGAWRNKNTQLKRMAISKRHTLLAMGHVHQVLWEPQVYLEPSDDDTIEARLQYWLATGGFLKDASYAEAKSYPPSLVGSPVVRFFSSHNDLDMWQLPYRSKYFEEMLNPVEGVKGTSEKFKERTLERPPCPRCNNSDQSMIISRGKQWHCKVCGRYYLK